MTTEVKIQKIIDALKEIRVSLVTNEYVLQDVIKDQFDKHDISYTKEYKLGARKRVDFLIQEGIIIEVKRGSKRPNRTQLITQLKRYSESDDVKVIIYVGERNVDLPKEINGKPCIAIGLNKNWGLSL